MQKIQLPRSLKGKNVLVAGAAGFIPSHLCEIYLELGANVFGVDNFITGSPANIDLLAKKYENFRFIEANIYTALPEFKNICFDYIFSLASPASPIDFAKIPMEIMMVNSEGTRRLLELAKRDDARFLEASTSEVYGDPEIHPQVETYNGNVSTIGPRSCYDEAKRFAEAMTMTYHRHYQVDTRIVRIFNTYGPRMRPNDGRVIPNFINQALKNEPITVYGDGSQTRSFCFVLDLCQAMHTVMFSDDHTPFNIGNPDEYSILQTAELIIKFLGSQSKIIFKSLPTDDPKQRRPDLTKLQSVSDYVPKVTFESGLKKTAEFFKSFA
jgi:dTDP-glucose 4,6-dehydratase